VYLDQRAFLSSIQQVALQQLDNLYTILVEHSLLTTASSLTTIPPHNGESPIVSDMNVHQIFQIIVYNQLFLPKYSIPLPVLKFITDELNFLNTERLMKKRINRSTYNTPKYINCIQENEQFVLLPRGFLEEFESFCMENNIVYELLDQREKKKEI
jgi:hypothetical protein